MLGVLRIRSKRHDWRHKVKGQQKAEKMKKTRSAENANGVLILRRNEEFVANSNSNFQWEIRLDAKISSNK